MPKNWIFLANTQFFRHDRKIVKKKTLEILTALFNYFIVMLMILSTKIKQTLLSVVTSQGKVINKK